MARRNLFQPPAPPSTSSTTATSGEQKSRFPNTGAMSGVKSTLKDVASNAVREISVDVIEENGPKDRLTFTDADVVALAASIKAHGQQVPIMVRPLADRPGHYRIVYGRRRLRALRSLGLPAKALVRSLSDEEAILAQGQENTQRLDPSFIEKALFAAELATTGYEQAIILDALAVDKPMLSRMTKVARSIPQSVIEQIGSAHGIGRRRWEELADQMRTHDVDLEQIAQTLDLDAAKTSDDRFGLISDAVARAVTAKATAKPAPSPTLTVKLGDGTVSAEVKETARALTVKLSKSEAPEFVQWVRDSAEAELTRLYEAWQSAQTPD
ncbi:plasmid partitioning protein RepB [Celeribacter baekdonensis]|uniref:Plasmid partitioning protein RepB n=1 Tax=Celeribacter baekdonensis TaxID=875171 RepID=A0A2R4LXS0_9RHOB|nr:plasmid partitioning protein RepB [Celeribacter baekdonensis]AVW89697.1 plasmid partitioning protein RepB [Celeribacter baekdonensis]|tara:strand:- start:2216 stop:3193 length:978 start_codon:yes stop_codon:yes gene_type:complete